MVSCFICSTIIFMIDTCSTTQPQCLVICHVIYHHSFPQVKDLAPMIVACVSTGGQSVGRSCQTNWCIFV